jgi:Ni/Fe-hydrogenase subunit HybB-like protein
MADTHAGVLAVLRPFVHDKLLLGQPPRAYAKSLLTPANLVAGAILALGLPLIAYRFAYGLGAATNLSQTSPWGLWIGFDMLCGVALAAGGFTLAASVHLLGLHDYHAIVRPAVLTAFLGYVFAVLGLLTDLGQPWRIVYPVFLYFGTTSVMFEVGWCVFLYTTVLLLEFSPAALEWLGLPKLRDFLVRLTVPLTVMAVLLSTLHQSSLGSLFLMAPGKLHPLWYSPYIPIFFFVSAIAAGLGMVIVESSLAHRLFRRRVDEHVDLDRLTLGLGKAGAVVLFSYFFLKLQGIAAGPHWDLLTTGWGLWFLVELVGFVLFPSLLLAWAVRHADVARVRLGGGLAVLGVILNRLNVSIIAFNWNLSDRYVPSWIELVVSITLVTLGIQVYRFIVNRMPILSDEPAPLAARTKEA